MFLYIYIDLYNNKSSCACLILFGTLPNFLYWQMAVSHWVILWYEKVYSFMNVTMYCLSHSWTLPCSCIIKKDKLQYIFYFLKITIMLIFGGFFSRVNFWYFLLHIHQYLFLSSTSVFKPTLHLPLEGHSADLYSSIIFSVLFSSLYFTYLNIFFYFLRLSQPNWATLLSSFPQLFKST